MKSGCMSKKVASLVLVATILAPNVVYADELIQKDETVFVVLKKNGEVKSQIISDWIHSDKSNVEISDKSILTNIKNVKGNEEPVKQAEKLVWKSDKNDIYYQGTTDKELPIQTNITYSLDGKEISGEEIIGKSGEVKIKIELVNLDKHQVDINGETKEMYTPFTTATVVNLPQDKFTNIKLDGGQMLSDGNNQVISFVAFPGLKQSLSLDGIIDDLDLDISLQDSMEISAHVDNFEMGPIYITAAPNLIESEEFKKATTLDELRDGINEITDASSKLAEGALKLADGGNTFYTKMGEFNEGINSLASSVTPLAEGINSLAAGAESADAGASDLVTGTKQLSDGVNQFGVGAVAFASGSNDFSTNATKISEGAIQLTDSYEKLADGAIAAGTGTKSISDGLSQLSEGTKKAYEGSAKLSETSKALSNNIQGISAELKGIPTEGLSEDQINKLNDCIAKIQATEAISKGIWDGNADLSGNLKAISDSTGTLSAGAVQVNAGINQLAEGGKAVKPYADTLNEGSKQLQAGAIKLNDASVELKTASEQIVSGSKALIDGSIALSTGLNKLVKEGTTPLKLKLPELVSGVAQIKDGSNQLYDASEELANGSKELSDNMTKFNEEGIKEIDEKASPKLDDIQEVIDRKDKLVEISDDYGTFAGLSSDMDGKVKFVMKTEDLKAVKEVVQLKVESTEKDEENGFFSWIKNIFNKDNDEKSN
ncbi:hypothetical protein [Clostridium grantii]|uniref:Putative membrane protein n=1 Tax=Clostridium grantii DSM 8605 TaxID=1121316 RepID=A0A1M5TGD7_9CLOT|nr:hypothetical protein [Clostridium grantii]SHH49812.1 putative membrane protein [Clostridium grantii DSM 8605]